MDFPSSDENTVKTEQGNEEAGGSEILDTDIDIVIKDVKMECREYSEKMDQIDGKKI